MTHLGKKPQELSVEELYRSVRALAPKVAVFDYDGTLWPGDAGSGFMRWTIEHGVLSTEAAAHILQRHEAYHRGEVAETPICGEMVQIYAGLPDRVLRESARAYFQEQVRPHLFPEMAALVMELKDAGVEVWAVSSTNQWMIEEGVLGLGIAPDRVLAACVAIEGELVTETLLDVPSDEGKAAALRRAGVHAPDAVFGNSVHDAAMLRMAGRAFPVNPSPDLAQLSADLGWPVYYPAAVVKTRSV